MMGLKFTIIKIKFGISILALLLLILAYSKLIASAIQCKQFKYSINNPL